MVNNLGEKKCSVQRRMVNDLSESAAEYVIPAGNKVLLDLDSQ